MTASTTACVFRATFGQKSSVAPPDLRREGTLENTTQRSAKGVDLRNSKGQIPSEESETQDNVVQYLLLDTRDDMRDHMQGKTFESDANGGKMVVASFVQKGCCSCMLRLLRAVDKHKTAPLHVGFLIAL